MRLPKAKQKPNGKWIIQVMVDGERGILVIRGAIPGPKGGIVTVQNTVKA